MSHKGNTYITIPAIYVWIRLLFLPITDLEVRYTMKRSNIITLHFLKFVGREIRGNLIQKHQGKVYRGTIFFFTNTILALMN